MSFTCGRGNGTAYCHIEQLSVKFVNKKLKDLIANMRVTHQIYTGDSQWVGLEKGVIQLATAKAVNKPVWKLVIDMTLKEFVQCIDFRYITDVITPKKLLRCCREVDVRVHGYPSCTTSAGCYDKVRRLIREFQAEGFTYFKQNVGSDIQADIRVLMMDAYQVWDVQEAINWMQEFLPLKSIFIEEPTSPDDMLGHAAIPKAHFPRTKVTTDEHIQNRIIFKQLFQTQVIDFCQVNLCRLAGVNEVLAILLMATKFNIPNCPHAGGVGLCEYVQHLSLIDYICITGTTKGSVLEYVDHLHEHFGVLLL
ncbi:enolase C-terminal domain-like protein [Pilaira anomala]|nr:enolase C-terminal domain-like protein [Pilaira anomala]